ncbi:MAG: DUF4395 domain-containing protein [Leptospiraceae bacterium]|nr:DUF4395 domain-containing protein [Leptospiraceae bacterium]
MIKIGSFPEVVNENSARLVAFFVLILSVSTIYFQNIYLIVCLAFGFFLRVLYGPSYEPIAVIVTKFIVPKFNIQNIPTPGPPKRFAQTIGFLFSFTGLVFFLSSEIFYFQVTLGILSFFAFLESVLGFCAGCFVFSYLMKWGFIPKEICERCNNIQYKK